MTWYLLSGLIGTGLLGPNRVGIERAYGLSHAGFGLVIAVVQVGCAAGVLVLTPRLKRYPLAGVVLAGLLAQTAGFVCIATVPHVAGIVAGWGLVTVGVVLGSLFNNVSMALWPADPRRGVALLHAFNAVGKFLGPVVAAGVALLAWSWQGNFLLVAAITAGVFVAFVAMRGSFRAVEQPAPSGALGLGVLKRGTYWMCTLPFGLIAGSEFAFATLLPTYLVKEAGMEKGAANMLFALHLAGLAAGRFYFAGRGGMSSNRIIGLCMLAGLAVVPAVLVDHLAVRLPLLFVSGVMFSSTWPTFYAQVSGRLAAHREMLAYGSSLGNFVGMSVLMFASSAIADVNLTAGVLFGPAMMGVFAALYFGTYLSRPVATATAGAAGATGARRGDTVEAAGRR